jgi:hypothetical protein
MLGVGDSQPAPICPEALPAKPAQPSPVWPLGRKPAQPRYRRRALLILTLAVGAALGEAPVAAASTLRVTTTRDELTSPAGICSLREAIAAVDAPGTRTSCGIAGQKGNTIVLRAGRYRLSLPATGEDDNASGDLNVTARASLTIAGRGTAVSVLDAGGLDDRVLSVGPGARVTLRRLRITGGLAPTAPSGVAGLHGMSCALGGAGGHGYDAGPAGDGGGIYNAGTLNLDRVVVIGNAAGAGGPGGRGGGQGASGGCPGGDGGQGGAGGGIYNQGSLTLNGATITGNTAGAGGPGGSSGGVGGPGGAGGPGGLGGGVYNQGQLSVLASAIYDNRAGAGGVGGQAAQDGPGNDGTGGAGASGGGVFSTNGTLEVVNSTLAGNLAGTGGAGGGRAGQGGDGGDGGGVSVVTGQSLVRNATLSGNGVGRGGTGGPNGGPPGAAGQGGALFVQSFAPADNMRLQNSIVSSSLGSGCAGSRRAITDGGHDLSHGDRTCPGGRGDPRLGSLQYNGGPTPTLALGRGSAAIDRIPGEEGQCPARDQRGVLRPAGRACDIGAYQHALPTIAFLSPAPHGSYRRGSRLVVRFRCSEGGLASLIVSCRGSMRPGEAIKTGRAGTGHLTVTTTDRSGRQVTRRIAFSVWTYVNPLRAIRHLRRERIDMGVDYGGSGPLLALGRARVTVASNHAPPSKCRGITCWIGGGAVIYRLLDGPFAGRSVYLAENITVTARVGQIVRAGQRIAVLHPAQPNMETGWASGHGPQTLAIADRHECTCGDPGGWSTIEGRNFSGVLVRLGAPGGVLQPNPPDQRMPPGWPVWR